jgi:glycine C-acetyltransferase
MRADLFSNSLAPAVAAASLEAFDMIMRSTELRDKLDANMRLFRRRMEEAGFDLGVRHCLPPSVLLLARS